MSTINKKEISDALITAMDREDLHTREAAKLLNLMPAYISMAKNEKNWHSMGTAPWVRLEEWLDSRLPIRDFKIPEGEKIYVLPEKTNGRTVIKVPVKDIVDTTGYTRPQPAATSDKEGKKNGKVVKLVINRAEIKALQDKVITLERANCLLSDKNTDLAQKLFVLEDETIAVMRQQIKDLREGMNHLVTIPKPEDKPSIVVFQRNIYHS